MNPNRFLSPRRWQWFALLLLTVGVTGCSAGPARGKVAGKVTFRKEPISDSTILFENQEAGIGVTAPLAADGSYEVKNYQGAGLPPGTYKVAISPGGIMKSGNEVPLAGKEPPRKKSTSKIPARYHQTATSKLVVEVKAGNNPPFDFDLTP